MFKHLLRQILCSLILLASTHAQDPSLESAEQIYSEVLSPFCPGRALKDCPSSSADELKTKILIDLNSGKSKQEILDELYQTYGDDIRSVPAFKGLGLFAWLAPVLFVVIGLIFLFVNLSKTKSKISNSKEQWR